MCAAVHPTGVVAAVLTLALGSSVSAVESQASRPGLLTRKGAGLMMDG